MSTRGNLFKNKINIIAILILLAISIGYGYLEKRDFITINKIIYYGNTEFNDVIAYDVDGTKIKKINKFNEDFKDNYKKENIEVVINPISANKYIYEMVIHSKDKLSEEKNSSIINDYTLYVKDKDKDIKFINIINEPEYNFSNKSLNNVFFRALSAIIYLAACFYFISKLGYKNKKILSDYKLFAIFAALGIVSMVLNFQFLLSISLILLGVLINYAYAHNNEGKFIISAYATAFAIRILAIIAMVVLNLYKFGTKLSYLQPDEMFYYETSNKISLLLYNFKWPDLKGITEVTQYAYNLFAGVVKLLNIESFYSLKIINALISCLFIVMVYDFAMKLFKNKSVARLSAIFMTLMPTMILFSTFALRDIFISMFIFLIFKEVFTIDIDKRYIISLIKILIYSFILWYLRNYALILIAMIVAFYVVLKLCVRRNINLIYVFIIGIVGLAGALTLASKLYSFSLLKMFINYFRNEGIVKYVTGIVLSITNLDFITNTSASLYSSPKTIILRMFYPETLLLVITLPLFVIGVKEFIKTRKDIAYSLIIMFIGFITIYKLQYGGWFLRTQLQIFPYQYVFISLGLIHVINESNFFKQGKGFNLVNRLLNL
ncbi:hypothetical protein [Desnuesiella massiliensis]|uniref:hypothetical protein n=1 Tax=Desnuesiella massiliensis TaxID=1650662 RepID=UPI0006E2367D|nr:hypothetical protein [Desnuesiella massiliensis]